MHVENGGETSCNMESRRSKGPKGERGRTVTRRWTRKAEPGKETQRSQEQLKVTPGCPMLATGRDRSAGTGPAASPESKLNGKGRRDEL